MYHLVKQSSVASLAIVFAEKHNENGTNPPVIACRKLALKVELRFSFSRGFPMMCIFARVVKEFSYDLTQDFKFQEQNIEGEINVIHFLPCRVTQADIVTEGIGDSNQRRFMTSCRSRGASNL